MPCSVPRYFKVGDGLHNEGLSQYCTVIRIQRTVFKENLWELSSHNPSTDTIPQEHRWWTGFSCTHLGACQILLYGHTEHGREISNASFWESFIQFDQASSDGKLFTWRFLVNLDETFSDVHCVEVLSTQSSLPSHTLCRGQACIMVWRIYPGCFCLQPSHMFSLVHFFYT